MIGDARIIANGNALSISNRYNCIMAKWHGPGWRNADSCWCCGERVIPIDPQCNCYADGMTGTVTVTMKAGVYVLNYVGAVANLPYRSPAFGTSVCLYHAEFPAIQCTGLNGDAVTMSVAYNGRTLDPPFEDDYVDIVWLNAGGALTADVVMEQATGLGDDQCGPSVTRHGDAAQGGNRQCIETHLNIVPVPIVIEASQLTLNTQQ